MPLTCSMKKIVCYMLIGLMLLSMAGCAAEVPVSEVVEEVVEETEAPKEPELIVGQATAEGMVPSGIIGLFLNGADAEERLLSLAEPLGPFVEECYNNGGVTDWQYMGMGDTETGKVMNFSVGEGANLSAFIEGLQEVTKDAGFNEGESWIECDMAKPPFLYSKAVMRNMFENSLKSDVICQGLFYSTGSEVPMSENLKNKIVKKNAIKYGYSESESTLTAEDYLMSTYDPLSTAFVAAGEARVSLQTAVPEFLCTLNESVKCVETDEFLTRDSSTLKNIFGTEILESICQIGCAKAEAVLPLGSKHILQSNWAMVYTDANGNFRVRLSLMVKDPAGKTGWYVTAYEVLVNPVEGDMFTCAEYEATGEIIQLIPYISFEKSMECGKEASWEAFGSTHSHPYGGRGLTPIEIAHAFYAAGMGDELEKEWPDCAKEHRENCTWSVSHAYKGQ